MLAAKNICSNGGGPLKLVRQVRSQQRLASAQSVTGWMAAINARTPLASHWVGAKLGRAAAQRQPCLGALSELEVGGVQTEGSEHRDHLCDEVTDFRDVIQFPGIIIVVIDRRE